jgi:hypothetical protein
MAKRKQLNLLVIKSADIDEPTLKKIRKQFRKAMKNGKKRTAILSVNPEDDVQLITVKR